LPARLWTSSLSGGWHSDIFDLWQKQMNKSKTQSPLLTVLTSLQQVAPRTIVTLSAGDYERLEDELRQKGHTEDPATVIGLQIRKPFCLTFL
jgi:hypothetical protein